MKHLEDDLQAACITWFDYQYPKLKNLLFHVPNGGHRNIREAYRLKKQGVRPGVSDLILLIPKGNFHGMCIEIKSEKGKLSDNQKEWLESVQNNGYLTIVCFNFNSFKCYIDAYLNLPNTDILCYSNQKIKTKR
jgi:hypothetical protein